MVAVASPLTRASRRSGPPFHAGHSRREEASELDPIKREMQALSHQTNLDATGPAIVIKVLADATVGKQSTCCPPGPGGQAGRHEHRQQQDKQAWCDASGCNSCKARDGQNHDHSSFFTTHPSHPPTVSSRAFTDRRDADSQRCTAECTSRLMRIKILHHPSPTGAAIEKDPFFEHNGESYEPNILSPDGSDDAVMRAHLDSILADARVPTGSLVAHILHDLFLSEVRQQGGDVAERAWKGLDAAAVKELGREFAERMSRPNSRDYRLPAGTVMTVGMFGCAFVGCEELGFDVDRPGLHDERELPTRPGGSNLARLLRRVDELTQELPCRAIGMPTLVERCIGDHPEHHLQFPAFAPAGGVVLQRAMNYAAWGEFFCAFTHTMIDELAEDVVKDMQRLWIDGRFFAPNICSIRKTATGVACEARGVQVHAVTLDISNQLSGGVRLAVEFKAWDHALRRGLVVQEISAPPGDKSELNAAALDLSDKVAAVHSLGADGRINVLARAIVNAAPQGAAAVLADLAANFETFVTLPTRTGPVHLRLYWQHGEIGAKTWGGHKIEISRDTVKLRDETQPETLKISLRGRPLYAIFDEPFRCDARIARVENRCGDLVITPEPDPWMVDCRAGRMWPDAELTAI